MKEIVFHQKLLEKAYFIFKITDAAMVRPASSDFWKAPLVSVIHRLSAVERPRHFLYRVIRRSPALETRKGNWSRNAPAIVPGIVTGNLIHYIR